MSVIHWPPGTFWLPRFLLRSSHHLKAKGPSHNQWVLGIIAVLFVIASVVPWPYVVSPLYGIPVLIACLSLSPRAVALTASVAVALNLVSSVVQRLPWLPDSVNTIGLLLIAILAVLAARHRQAAEAATQRLQTFMNFVAHELRTPLTTQWGYLQLIELSSQSTMPEVEQQALSAIAGATQVLRRLADDLVDGVGIEGGQLTIHLRLGIEAGQAIIHVTDHGLGINREQMKLLFQPYSRLHHEYQIEGLGLGLYLCKAIVEGHGGHIWAESEPGAGSTFHVALPLSAS